MCNQHLDQFSQHVSQIRSFHGPIMIRLGISAPFVPPQVATFMCSILAERRPQQLVLRPSCTFDSGSAGSVLEPHGGGTRARRLGSGT